MTKIILTRCTEQMDQDILKTIGHNTNIHTNHLHFIENKEL
jgi:hypothetical protein